MKDSLGDRMKHNYEDRWRIYLPRRSYVIVRVDGKAFHSYTRGLGKPWDEDLLTAMRTATMEVFWDVQGCQFAYGQSDEVSFLLTDFNYLNTEAYFDYNLQKICSVVASIFTAHFNDTMRSLLDDSKRRIAYFDARVFQIPDPVEVQNYFIWRMKDAERNSVQSLGQAHFSAKELHRVSVAELKEKLEKEKGIKWDDLEDLYKYGWVVDEDKIHRQAWDFVANRIEIPQYNYEFSQ